MLKRGIRPAPQHDDEADRPAAVDDVEASRRLLETRTERKIQRISMGVLASLMVAFQLYHLYDAHGYFPPPQWWVFMSMGVMGSLSVTLYLSRKPPYQPLLKYLLTVMDVTVITGAFAGLKGSLDEEVFAIVPLPAYALMIVATGQRYSSGVVRLAGLMAVLAYTSWFSLNAPDGLRMACTIQGVVLLTAMSTTTAEIVGSLLNLERQLVFKKWLTRFLAPELVDEVIRDPALLDHKVEQREATVLFADIRGFTNRSERMAPLELVEDLNRFLEEATASISHHGGMVDKYIGDAVMAVFGVPIGCHDHATRAVRAALELRERIFQMNALLVAAGREPFAVGIGIHTGAVVAGTIGASSRLEYTVIGDTVNVAARIEALARSGPVSIMMSDATRQAVGDTIPLERVGEYQLRGRAQSTMLWGPRLPSREMDASGPRPFSASLKLAVRQSVHPPLSSESSLC